MLPTIHFASLEIRTYGLLVGVAVFVVGVYGFHRLRRLETPVWAIIFVGTVVILGGIGAALFGGYLARWEPVHRMGFPSQGEGTTIVWTVLGALVRRSSFAPCFGSRLGGRSIGRRPPGLGAGHRADRLLCGRLLRRSGDGFTAGHGSAGGRRRVGRALSHPTVGCRRVCSDLRCPAGASEPQRCGRAAGRSTARSSCSSWGWPCAVVLPWGSSAQGRRRSADRSTGCMCRRSRAWSVLPHSYPGI